jgi:ribosomal protein L23
MFDFSNYNKKRINKTWEEIYGIEKANLMRIKAKKKKRYVGR